ncbi:hypothetical protein GCM10011344_15480 [Dokdonia pacifica]|uniref:Uncharacterized protein n=1 Tax=Dokdonia pacifica TaxID=1627892 RepID=A0A238W3L9_9FLAO|nr:hypothetical protein [Dokdonia pacifica]GGG15789.1 hypothetical protein GCM10011344_15480 [Dokdonia pacifica]SNR40309.1 hypothetical protein SAMN06265376_101595 [Dokdonia pacifica]
MTFRTINLILVACLISIGCKKDIEQTENTLKMESPDNTSISLLDNVKLAINPTFEDWVLFENGTYIIFDETNSAENIEAEALKLIKEFGPVSAGGPAGDFNVISLNKTKGWVVSGHGYGMYTYVHPDELDTDLPNDVVIGLFGRSKRDKDGNNPKIIHINRSN